MPLSSLITSSRGILNTYWERLQAFHPNARLYLLSIVLTGAALGVYRLLYNFYILSQGYDEAVLGLLVTTSSLTVLLSALPMGYLADFIGRKPAFILGGISFTIALVLMLLWPSIPILILMNVLMGLGQSLSGVAMGPFLMENSGEKERTYLFSFSSGFQMASAFFGNWLGGVLPSWASEWLKIPATSTQAYGTSLLVVAAFAFLSTLPLFFIKRTHPSQARAGFAPLYYFKAQPRLLVSLILPMLVTSIGAGMIMPFMNVFFRQVHHQSDAAIGTMFAYGSLAMGLGLMIAPPLADRFGKIQVVVLTQAISIPFLVLLGFAPWFPLSAVAYYIRLVLMNMSGPIYQTFVMEQIEERGRATIASLVSMANSFGWAFSPMISGWLQVHSGFQLPYLITVLLYLLSVTLYWRFFWNQGSKDVTFSHIEHQKM